MKLILASTSKYKQNQLKTLGLCFEAISPKIIENHSLCEDPNELAKKLATLKATSIHNTDINCWILGSDQTAITKDGELLFKPGSTEAAVRQLKKSSNQIVSFYSAISLVNDEKVISWSVQTDVKFRKLTANEIVRYINHDQPLDCAGSFKVESLGISLFEWIRSEDPTALIGLPLISLSEQLRQLDFLIP